jgi:enoyl-CoA hydratase
MPIHLDRQTSIACITLDRPEVQNALDLPALDALAAAWDEVDRDPEVRVVVITGAGDRAFSVGADLKRFNPAGAKVELRHAAFFPATNKPIVAAVNGLCLAGGCELLGATDLRVAAEHATFAITEAKLGLFPAGGSAVRLPRQLPWPLAMELMITGRPITAAEALRWGLVNQVVPADRVRPAAFALAERVAALSPVAVAAIKQCARDTLGLPLADAFAAQVAFTRRVIESDDAQEGPRAFLEKRPPQFTGQTTGQTTKRPR